MSINNDNLNYIVFVGDGETLILCYDQYSDKQVFLMTPQEVLNKYMEDMDYTDFAGGKTRSDEQISPYTSDKPATCNYSGLRSTKSYTD